MFFTGFFNVGYGLGAIKFTWRSRFGMSKASQRANGATRHNRGTERHRPGITVH